MLIDMAGEVGATSEVNNLGGFVEAANAYGVTGIEWHKEGDNSVLEQNVGEGWPGLGKSPDKVWMGLTPEARRPNQGWNENTLLEEGKVYKGVTPGEQGALAFDHPLRVFFGALHKTNPDIQIHVTGEYAGWDTNEKTRLQPDEQGNLVGNIPTGKEIKVVVTPVQAEWKDGGWKNGEKQKLTIKPTPTVAVK